MTVVTPTFNQAPFIGETLQSVLDQNIGPRLQYIVQDNCSTDGTDGIVQEYEAAFQAQGVEWRYVREKDTGQADAINRGWRVATGDILGFLNSDDLYRPGALQAVLDYFENNRDGMWAYGGWRLINRVGQCYSIVHPKPYRRSALLNHCIIGQPACFFRRECLKEVGDLDTTLHLAMDYDLWLRISELYPAGIIPAELAEMRYYPAAKSAASVRRQAQEIYRLATNYSLLFSWRRWCQRFYYFRCLAVIMLRMDVSRRIERMKNE